MPIVIAHRGASGYLPEHTLAAKELAHAMGADYLEQDVVLTRDGVPIVLHDVFLEAVTDVGAHFPERRRADGRFYAIDFDLAELLRLAVHERIDPSTGAPLFPDRHARERMRFALATLAEEIELIRGLNASTGGQAGLYPEIKAPEWHRRHGKDISRIVLEVLAQYGYRTRDAALWLQCFDAAELKRIRTELGSQLKLTQLIGENDWGDADVDFERLRTAAGLRDVARYAQGVGVWIPHVVRWRDAGETEFSSLTADAHAVGLSVHVYTLRRDRLPAGAPDFEAVHAALLRAGVDGVFSDFPDDSVRWMHALE